VCCVYVCVGKELVYWMMACCVYVCVGKEFSLLDDGVLCVCVCW